jgi:hypothetical protein
MALSFLQFRRIFSATILGGILLILAVLIPKAWIKSQLKQKQLLREGPAIVEAINAFRESNHRFPSELKELKNLRLSEGARWYFYSYESGQFGLDAYIGWGRTSVDYRSFPENPELNGWFLQNDNEESVRITPPKP